MSLLVIISSDQYNLTHICRDILPVTRLTFGESLSTTPRRRGVAAGPSRTSNAPTNEPGDIFSVPGQIASLTELTTSQAVSAAPASYDTFWTTFSSWRSQPTIAGYHRSVDQQAQPESDSTAMRMDIDDNN